MGKVIFDRTGKVSENRIFLGQVFLMYFARSRNPYNPQNSIYGNNEFTEYRKSMRKDKYSKDLSFLHIMHSSISLVIETHTIPKTWANWILIVRKMYGKTQAFYCYRSLTYFIWSIYPYNFQSMGKVNSHSKEKIGENTNI